MISFFAALLLILTVLCVIGSILLIYYSRRTNSPNLLLGIYFILLVYPIFITFLISSGLILRFPHFYRTGMPAALLAMPASYLFIRSLFPGKPLRRADLLHLLPALIYLVDLFPFFQLPGDAKLDFYGSPNLSKKVIIFSESRFFPVGFYTLLKYVVSIVYWILQAILLYRLFRIKDEAFRKENNWMLRWLLLFALFQLPLCVPPLYFFNGHWENNTWLIFFYSGGPSCFSAILLLVFPELLYGMKGVLLAVPSQSAIAPTDKGHSIAGAGYPEKLNGISLEMAAPAIVESGRYLSEEKLDAIGTALQHHLASNHPYLKHQYTLQQLSNDIGFPYQYISAYINDREKMNYNDFINRYRITHCLKLIEQQVYRTQTLESIAHDCGFNNRNSFTVAFKKVTGLTPSQYVRQLRHSDNGRESD